MYFLIEFLSQKKTQLETERLYNNKYNNCLQKQISLYTAILSNLRAYQGKIYNR